MVSVNVNADLAVTHYLAKTWEFFLPEFEGDGPVAQQCKHWPAVYGDAVVGAVAAVVDVAVVIVVEVAAAVVGGAVVVAAVAVVVAAVVVAVADAVAVVAVVV